MSRPRFLADQNLNEHIVDGVLRLEPAVEFARARDFGWNRSDDAELLARATAEGFIVVSHDVNTMPAQVTARLKAGDRTTGLLLVRQSTSIRPVIDSLILIWSSSDAEEWHDRVVFLPL